MPRKGKSSFVVTPDGSQYQSSSGRNVSRVNSRPTAGFNMNTAANVAAAGQQVYNALPPDAQSAVNHAVKSGAKAVKNKVAQTVSKHSRWVTMGGSSNHSPHSSGYGLSKAPIPAPIKLDTGLKPDAYVDNFMEASYNMCVPMNVTAALVQIPTTSGNQLLSYFNNIIAFSLQTNAQRNVSFNIDITTNFSTANILQAFNALLYALQIYFYYKSIITYHDEPSNHNMGMVYIRKQMDASFIESLELLERRLLDTPVPPRMLDFIRYLSGNFYAGDAAGAPLIKIVPIPPNSNMYNSNDATLALSALSNTANNNVFTVLRKAVPQWRPSVLYDVPKAPFYDQNFKSIFANLPFISYYGSAQNYLPTITDSNTAIIYNSFTNHLDGVAYALAGGYVSGSGWLPGLIQPVQTTSASTTNLNTRWSYYVDGASNYKFYPTDLSAVTIRSRQETIMLADSLASFYTIHLAGAQLLQNVKANSIRQSAYNALDYLMSLDLIRIDARKHLLGGSN